MNEMLRDAYHEGEPDLHLEEDNWLALPEELRERIEGYIQGTAVDWSEEERVQLQRYLRWNLIYLHKLIYKEQQEHAAEGTDVIMKGLLERYQAVQRRIEMKVLADALHREQEKEQQ